MQEIKIQYRSKIIVGRHLPGRNIFTFLRVFFSFLHYRGEVWFLNKFVLEILESFLHIKGFLSVC